MSARVGIIIDGELQVFDDASQIAGTGYEGEPFAVPEGFPEAVRWTGAAFEAIPPALPARQIYYRLFTVPERAMARRLAVAVWPEGHPFAGQLMDPDGVVQVLIDSLLASDDMIAADSELHQQGVALLAGLGVLTPERAAQVLAMEPAPAN